MSSYIIVIEEPTPHLTKQGAEWTSSNLSAFRTRICSSPLIMISADGPTWGKYLYYPLKHKKMQLF